MEIIVPNNANLGINKNIDPNTAIEFANRLKHFTDWKKNLETKFSDINKFKLGKISILDVVPFGPDPSDPRLRKGFVFANAEIYNKDKDGNWNTRAISGASLIRGGASAVLVIVENNNKQFVVTTVQPRIPGAEPEYIEIPAGMTDDGDSFESTALKELKEELGPEMFDIKVDDLKYLTTMHPSIGGCDETIKIFYTIMKKNDEDFKKLEKYTRNEEDGVTVESLSLKVFPYEKFREMCLDSTIKDAKAQLALLMYEAKTQSPAGKPVRGSLRQRVWGLNRMMGKRLGFVPSREAASAARGEEAMDGGKKRKQTKKRRSIKKRKSKKVRKSTKKRKHTKKRRPRKSSYTR